MERRPRFDDALTGRCREAIEEEGEVKAESIIMGAKAAAERMGRRPLPPNPPNLPPFSNRSLLPNKEVSISSRRRRGTEVVVVPSTEKRIEISTVLSSQCLLLRPNSAQTS